MSFRAIVEQLNVQLFLIWKGINFLLISVMAEVVEVVNFFKMVIHATSKDIKVKME